MFFLDLGRNVTLFHVLYKLIRVMILDVISRWRRHSNNDKNKDKNNNNTNNTWLTER